MQSLHAYLFLLKEDRGPLSGALKVKREYSPKEKSLPVSGKMGTSVRLKKKKSILRSKTSNAGREELEEANDLYNKILDIPEEIQFWLLFNKITYLFMVNH